MKTIHAMLLAAALSLTAPSGASKAFAADNSYDGKNVSLILPNSPAGPMAQYARTLAPYINKHLGAKAVRVDIQQGAGGLKGASSVWRAAPDGLTFALTNLSALIMAPCRGAFPTWSGPAACRRHRSPAWRTHSLSCGRRHRP